jgi:hypothetical protein
VVCDGEIAVIGMFSKHTFYNPIQNRVQSFISLGMDKFGH